ncbi:MAG: hypothetical protein Q9208_003355 [Pyrenodesmia sp. 3 TL-2023]
MADPNQESTDDPRVAAWKLPNLVTNFSEFMASSGTPVAMKEASTEDTREQKSTVEATPKKPESMEETQPHTMTSKDAEEGRISLPSRRGYESTTKRALGPTSSTNRDDASKAVPSSKNSEVTVGKEDQRVSDHGSPVNDPAKHPWPVAKKAAATTNLIDF